MLNNQRVNGFNMETSSMGIWKIARLGLQSWPGPSDFSGSQCCFISGLEDYFPLDID